MKVLISRIQQGVRHMLAFAVALLVIGFASTAAARTAKTDMVSFSDIPSGSYKLVTYEQGTTNDPVMVAILQKEGTPYNLKFGTRGIVKDLGTLPAEDAIKQAEAFVESSATVRDVEVAEIYGPDGTVLGYEVTPVFMPLRYGSSDVVDTHYDIQTDRNRTLASIGIDPLVGFSEQGGG